MLWAGNTDLPPGGRGLKSDYIGEGFPQMPPECFLFAAFRSGFLSPPRMDAPDRIQLQPAIIVDSRKESVSTDEPRTGNGPVLQQLDDAYFGTTCAFVITVLKDTDELQTDFAFRHRAKLDQETNPGSGAGKPTIEEVAFRYTFQCHPDDTIGFALPYRNRGHLFVIVSFEKVAPPPNFVPTPL